MKKIIITLILIATYSCANAQYSKANKTGQGLLVGGVAFTLAGFLTPAYQIGYDRSVPFYKQSPRNSVIAFGFTMTITGLFTAFKD